MTKRSVVAAYLWLAALVIVPNLVSEQLGWRLDDHANLTDEWVIGTLVLDCILAVAVTFAALIRLALHWDGDR